MSKLPTKELIIAAFCGGLVTSLLELANMLSSHENIIDLYFWAGAFIAGVIGVLGLFVSQAKDIGGAITSGVAAPQLLGGMAKVAPTVVSLIFSPIISPVYADEIVQDSIKVTTMIEDGNVYEIKPFNSDEGLLIRDTMTFMFPTGEIEISDNNKHKKQIEINVDTAQNTDTTQKEIIVSINSETYTQKPSGHDDPIQRILRGALGHAFRKKPIKKKKLIVNIIEKK